MELKRTGILGLDEFLRGGLPPSIVLLLGSPDKGNEMFARQVAIFRSKEVGVTYFTVAKTQDSIKTNMDAYGMNTAAQEKDGKWKFVNLPNSLSAIKTAVIKEMNQNRSVIVDSMSELLLNHDINEIAELITAMSTQNQKTQELHFILLTKGMQDMKSEITLQHFADGVIDFEAVWKADGLARNLMIQKMLGSTIPTQSVPYSLDEKGFIIETSTRIT